VQEELLHTAEYESRLDLGECKCSLYRVEKLPAVCPPALPAVCPPALPHHVKNIIIHLEKLIHKKSVSKSRRFYLVLKHTMKKESY